MSVIEFEAQKQVRFSRANAYALLVSTGVSSEVVVGTSEVVGTSVEVAVSASDVEVAVSDVVGSSTTSHSAGMSKLLVLVVVAFTPSPRDAKTFHRRQTCAPL